MGRRARSSPPDSGSAAEVLQPVFPPLNRRARQARLLQEALQAEGTAIEMVPLPGLQQAMAHRFAADGGGGAAGVAGSQGLDALPPGRRASSDSLAGYGEPAPGRPPAAPAPREARWKRDSESLRIQPEALEVCGVGAGSP